MIKKKIKLRCSRNIHRFLKINYTIYIRRYITYITISWYTSCSRYIYIYIYTVIRNKNKFINTKILKEEKRDFLLAKTLSKKSARFRVRNYKKSKIYTRTRELPPLFFVLIDTKIGQILYIYILFPPPSVLDYLNWLDRTALTRALFIYFFVF